jgi:hypothetical protein
LGRILRILDRLTVEYLKSQIETGDGARTKKALQQLCKYYREGYRVNPSELIGLEQSIVGLLYTQVGDEKVRRWALNALARLGREPTCMEAIMHVLKQYSHEPQTSAAAIAAIYRMSRKASAVLRKLSFDEQMLTLAALQHVDAHKLDLTALPIKVETASPDLLKLALVVVGLDRAPNNMMHPRFSNSELVKALGGHHDNTVSQYTVWAITENPSLRLSDIGIDLKLVEEQPPNVRAWIFRLIAMTPEDAERNFEYLELGMRDPEPEARTGLALGLRNTFFDGLDALLLDWFTSEADAEVRQYLLDHMIKNFGESASYETMALEIYEKEPEGSFLRRRMEASASGSELYAKFKRMDLSFDLFRGAVAVTTNNTFNVSGGIQGGAVSLGGDATNLSPSSIHYNPQTIEALRSELSTAERELHQLLLPPDVKEKALTLITDAKADPSPSKIAKAIGVLKEADSVASKVVSTGTSLVTIGTAIAKIISGA